MNKLLTIALVLGLAGCAGRPLNTCPAPVEYSRDFLAGAADELEALPDGSKLGVMIDDYASERSALRACRA